MLTDRDITINVVAEGKNPAQMTAGSWRPRVKW
jgi:hypothetical protein